MIITKGKLAVAVLKLVGCLPLPLLRALGGIMGYCSWYCHSNARRITEINLRYCLPQLSHRARQTLGRRSLLHSCIGGLEMAALWRKSKQWTTDKIIATEGLSLLSDYLKKGERLMLMTPHIGNWEVLNVQLSQYGQNLSLYKPNALVELDEWILQARTRVGGQLVPTDVKGIKLLFAALKRGDMACVLPDQVPIDDKSSISAPFFGHQAKTMTLIYRFIQKTHCRVLFVYCKRVPGGFITVFKEPDQGIYSDDKLVSVAALNRSVEQCVLDVPEQYQWQYKRFKEAQTFYHH